MNIIIKFSLSWHTSQTDYINTYIVVLTGLARRVGAKILIASTSEVYGDPLVHPQPESYWGHVNPIGKEHFYLLKG